MSRRLPLCCALLLIYGCSEGEPPTSAGAAPAAQQPPATEIEAEAEAEVMARRIPTSPRIQPNGQVRSWVTVLAIL